MAQEILMNTILVQPYLKYECCICELPLGVVQFITVSWVIPISWLWLGPSVCAYIYTHVTLLQLCYELRASFVGSLTSSLYKPIQVPILVKFFKLVFL